jgi:phospholipase D1/2
MLEIGRNCWRIERADRAALIVDAANYFRIARQAMMRASKQILMIGWEFDTRICLDFDTDDDAPTELGAFVTWLPKQKPDLQIHMLNWDMGAVKLLGRGTTVLRLARWAAHKQIHFKLDGAHPSGASHHHKILVIDDRLAFCGGIDMTAARWDTRDHVDDDPRRHRPTTGRAYHPWHDATMTLDGDAARAIGDLARFRWKVAGGTPIEPPETDRDLWPDEVEPAFRDVEVAIARTRGDNGELGAIREIEALFLDSIQEARQFVYAENQFFASRTIAAAICKRLAEPDGPEFVIVNPRIVDGWVEEEVMSPARARLLRQVAEADRYGRFRLYTPVTKGGEDIYVHSKITIVDDEQLRVGSANLNNRSMGLDSECDVLIDARRNPDSGIEQRIAAIRCDLMAEHLGVAPDDVAAKLAETRSIVGAIEQLRGAGRSLVPFEPKPPNAIEQALADAEVLDPESAGELFEPLARPGLLAGLRSRRQAARRRHSRA